MAITFLALSRRERASVTVTTDQTTATLMSDTALARAQAEQIARMVTLTNPFAYEFIVSTNYISRSGFQKNLYFPNYTNVSYKYANGTDLSENDLLTNLHNLLYDPRPPVFVVTQANAPKEFRYYLDLNRNGKPEPTGLYATVNSNGLPTGRLEFMTGDPEWIGVLDKPGQPHSPTNRFIGRYAYFMVPEGKCLDLNFIHNQAKHSHPLGPKNVNSDGFTRNQGVGPWELNLAAFLTDLNTNQWPSNSLYNLTSYGYLTNYDRSSPGAGFSNALSILNYRYLGDYKKLPSAAMMLSNPVTPAGRIFSVLGTNQVDDYSDGPYVTTTAGLTGESTNQLPAFRADNATRPWSGSDHPQIYYDIQELFSDTKTSLDFTNRLLGNFNTNTARSTYDRYSFYRLLSQLGVDSASPTGKINLNYRNDGLERGTNLLNWTASNFFTLTADRMLRQQFSQFGLSISNIPIYPVNFYSSATHRLLQLAANIYDATTAELPTNVVTYPYLPSVFRPVFDLTNGAVIISGYVQEFGTNFLANPWIDLRIQTDRARLANANVRSNANVYGVPIIIGARKGYPNFNEYSMQSIVEITRKVEVRKPSVFARNDATNVMYILGVSNIFGIEAWNSYFTRNFARQYEVRAINTVAMALTNRNGVMWPTNGVTRRVVLTNTTIGLNWASNRFLLITNNNLNAIFLTNSIYNGRGFDPLNPAHFIAPNALTNLSNHIWLVSTNRLQYVMIDRVSRRVVDFVNLDNFVQAFDVTAQMFGNPGFTNDTIDRLVWDPVVGVTNQIQISLGNIPTTDRDWRSAMASAAQGRDKEKSIDRFRAFYGFYPIFGYSQAELQQELGKTINMQTPFCPTRKFAYTQSLQVNDPLVHYTFEDLYDPMITNEVVVIKPPSNPIPANNLGKLNRRYKPWGGSPAISTASDTNAYNLAFKDPMIYRSDDWDFPTNKFPNIGWLGRVHRGSPWQTVYLKSDMAETNAWRLWSGSYLTHPTNDWKMLELFTAGASPNASRGLLSVNQTNLAAWSAVLSGVLALTNSYTNAWPPTNVTEVIVQPSSRELRMIVEGINSNRFLMSNHVFRYMGDILSTPELSVNYYRGRLSPFLANTFGQRRDLVKITDAVYERIPQQILSLLKADEPRLTIYTFGQALAPAANSTLLSGPSRGLCTNYQILSEVAAKQVLRIEGAPTNPVVISEKFQYLPSY